MFQCTPPFWCYCRVLRRLRGGNKTQFYEGGRDAAGKVSGVIASWKERRKPPDHNA